MFLKKSFANENYGRMHRIYKKPNQRISISRCALNIAEEHPEYYLKSLHIVRNFWFKILFESVLPLIERKPRKDHE